MEFFKKYFKLTDDMLLGNGEYNVVCPFIHKDHAGNEYKEQRPSAHINPNNSVFHCKSCGVGISEASFLTKVEGMNYRDALKAIKLMEGDIAATWETRHYNLLTSPTMMKMVDDLGITSVAKELQLGFNGSGIDFPVFMYGEILDIRNYEPERTPKVIGTKGSTNLIIPFDVWKEDDRPTLLCAGEKDMAIARSKGFNAISFTGGEQSFPKMFKHSFKDRHIYIVYDNDNAGKEGSEKAAHFIKEAGGIPYIVTGHHEICIEKGGDLWDFFMKYGKTAQDLHYILENTPEADGHILEKIKEEHLPTIKISESNKATYVNKRFVRSKVSVLSIFDELFSAPEYVVFEQTMYDEGSIIPNKGDTIEWVLDEGNLKDLFYLIDGKITDRAKRDFLMAKCGLRPKSDSSVRMIVKSSIEVFKSVIKDAVDNSSDDIKQGQLTIYSLREQLYPGNTYEVTYKPIAHPLQGQYVVGIVNHVESSSSSIENFSVTDSVKKSLQVFQQGTDSVETKMNEIFERSKGFVGVESRRLVTWATDMFYHTPMDFKIGKRVERAYLDIMIVGDPRTMKSETAKRMREMYELGTIVSLKSATEAGLVGGANKVNGQHKTQVGLMPQSHKGAMILEEFSGGRHIIPKLTEVRSSGRARINRVDGHIDVPCRVRMLSISNPATKGGISLGIRQYPSGIKVLLDLIGASEDIARYDFFLLVDEPKTYTSPLDMFDLDPYDKESYMNRVRWAWSRKPEQVEISRNVAEYIVRNAELLNKDFDCHIKLFGAEAWKKIARVAISVACMLVSTDENFENVIVTKEHVDFATKFMASLYANEIFKLKSYVANERSYSELRDEDVAALQRLYNNHAPTLHEMEISVDMTQKQLQLVSGLDSAQFADLVARLGNGRFIQWQGERIVPTAKFRKAMPKMQSSYLKTPNERGY